MIGGMIGNNACGANSVVYKSTREHLLSVKALLSDGSETEFKSLTSDEFLEKCDGNTLEASLYRSIREQLTDPKNQSEIRKAFPKQSIDRRNTGYALDLLLGSTLFSGERGQGAGHSQGTSHGQDDGDFNFCKLVAGSEGTLAFITEAKLTLCPRSEEHTSELQSLMRTSYAVFCLKK